MFYIKFYLLLQAYDRGPFLFQKASIFSLHFPGHIGFFLKRLKRILITIGAEIVRDRLISGRRRKKKKKNTLTIAYL